MALSARACPVILFVVSVAAPAVARQLATDLTIDTFSTTYQGKDSTASVLVGAEVQGLTGLQADARTPRRLEVRYETPGGSGAAANHTVTVALDGSAPHIGDGVRVLARLPLAPGSHQVSITARDPVTGRAGSVTHEIDVPNLTPGLERVAMSGLLLTSSHVAGITHAEVEDDRMLPILGQPPSARRQFSQAEKVEVHAEIYEQPGFELDAGQLRVLTRVLSEDGKVIYESEDLGTSEALSGGRWGYEHSTLIPIGTLAPGRYVVQVVAEIQYDAPASTSRSASITVVAPPTPR